MWKRGDRSQREERGAPTPTHALAEEEKCFDAVLGESENRAQLRDPGRVQRGLEMKGWTCGSKPGAHVMTCYDYTTRDEHTFVLLEKIQ